MSEITEEKYQNIKDKAINYFKNNKNINSPSFWEIKITPEWFNHIEWKNKNHKRPMKESYIRYLCFLHTDYILKNSKLYQEYREEIQKFEIKRKWKKKIENKVVLLYWFVAIVNHNQNRVKIIVRKVDWWNKYEFISIIPLWKNIWYWNQLFFDNEEDYLKILEDATKKPSS